MPIEMRYIFFSKGELVCALQGYLKRQRRPLATGQVESIEIDDELGCRMVIASGPNQVFQQHRFRPDEVREALTFFCIDQKIPVPSTTLEKSIHLLGDALAMVISDSEMGEPRKQAVLNHIYHHQLRNLG
jgi:hypothetical protein